MSTVLTSPPATESVLEGRIFARLWFQYVSRVTAILAGKEPLRLASYTVATLPDASRWSGCLVYVTDEAGGPVPAFSDGAMWRRTTDRTEVVP